MEQGKVKGCDNLSYTKNDNGKYSFRYEPEDKKAGYVTGFIFDSMSVMSGTQTRVGRRDEDGNMKYGVICTKGWAGGFIIPCVFDKIKPFDGTDLLGIKDGKEYILNADGDVKLMSIFELYQKYD